MKQNIIARPYIRIKDLFSSTKQDYPLNSFFFNSGSDALVYGLRILEIQKGSNILVPAYICTSVTEALIKNGYNVIFQDVKMDLSFDFDLLRLNIVENDVKGILIINYFGLPCNANEVLRLCKNLGVFCIEDNCHSYLSNNCFHEEISADISVFSLRKSLPVKDGGVLRVNLKHIKKNTNHEIILNHKSFINDLPFLISKIAEYIISKLGIFNLYSDSITKIKDRAYKYFGNIKKEGSNQIKPTRPSFLLNTYLTNHSYEEEVKKKVTKNFDYLTYRINSSFLKPLLENRNEGTVPQYAIFFDSNATLCRKLRKKRIGASRWPANELPDFVRNNKKTFPNSNFFNENLVMIPIHKDITKKHLDSILDIIEH